jgi:hypothetical protein
MQVKDLSINGFTFRFIFEEGVNEWVCKMPTWLIEAAEDIINAQYSREQRLQQLLDEDRE